MIPDTDQPVSPSGAQICYHSQVVGVLGQLSIGNDVVEPGLSVIREIENVKHVLLFLLDHLPAEVDDRLQTEGFVILLPAMSNKNGVSIGKWPILELYKPQSRLAIWFKLHEIAESRRAPLAVTIRRRRACPALPTTQENAPGISVKRFVLSSSLAMLLRFVFPSHSTNLLCEVSKMAPWHRQSVGNAVPAPSGPVLRKQLLQGHTSKLLIRRQPIPMRRGGLGVVVMMRHGERDGRR